MKRQPRTRHSEPTVIDLFCGAGGLSYAFHRAGFRIITAVEKDKDAAASYKHSFIDVHSTQTELIVADIRSKEVARRLQHIYDENPQIDVVVGGPPCQDFSPARLKTRRNGNRASLVKTYFQIIEIMKPRVFMFENVPNLLKAADGKYWAIVEQAASSIGYMLQAHELCAEDFGVPQRRKRLFVIGTLSDFPTTPPRKSSRKAPTVLDTIGHLPALEAGEVSDDPMHQARKHRPYMVEYFMQIPPGGSWRNAPRRIPCQQGHNGHYDTYGRMRGDTLAPTLTGGCTNPSKGRFIHPSQHRGLTVREAALLQTFPRDWIFHGGIDSQSLQVGNAVPVKLGQALARHIRRYLNADL